MEREFFELVGGLCEILNFGEWEGLSDGKISEKDKGFSGAEVLRKKLHFKNGSNESLIFKKASLSERLTMKTLTLQNQNTPKAFSLDYESNEPMWMVMEDFGSRRGKIESKEDIESLSKTLSLIHTKNLNRKSELTFLPEAGESFWRDVTFTLSLSHFEKRGQEDSEFKKEFGKYLSPLREKGAEFYENMVSLSNNEEEMTLVHGDLNFLDGGHIFNLFGKTKIIDFGFSHRAPFYLDLSSLYKKEDLYYYYGELLVKGIDMSFKEFYEKAKSAFPYAGFTYLYPALTQYKNGEIATAKLLLQSIEFILEGDFPERRRNYSEDIFKVLVEKHRSK